MKFLRIFLVVFAITSVLSACRKGPEDPLLSFTTRKNRISNDWKAYSYRLNGLEIIKEDKIENFDIPSCGTQTVNTNLDRTIIMRFSKNGSFSESRIEKGMIQSTISSSAENCSVYNFNREINDVKGETGNWSFTGGANGSSKREQVFIFQSETKEGVLWDIVKLASDELKLKRSYIRPGESVFTTEEIFFKPNE